MAQIDATGLTRSDHGPVIVLKSPDGPCADAKTMGALVSAPTSKPAARSFDPIWGNGPLPFGL